MDQLTETDVLVIGAGPTGLTTANLLADLGVRVVLVDKLPGPGDEPRAISVTDETLRIMQQIGIMDRLGPEMLMDTGARYYGRKGQLLAETRPAGRRLGQPGKSQFDQPVMESLLLEAARERNIDIRFCSEAFSVQDRGTHAEVTLIDDAGKKTVRASWVVACDGGRSPVRTQLGIPMEGSTQVQKWIVIDILNTGEHEKFADFYCNGSRPCVVVPGVKGRRRFEFMLLPGETPAEMTTPEAVASLVRPFQEVRPEDIRRAAVYVAHQRVALTFRQGRVLLAGDAAHMMPPFAGQGLNAGIRDAANLAWKVAAAVKGTGTDALVSTYDTERRPHARDMVRISHRIGKVVMSTNPKLTPLRDAAITASGIVPAVKAWLVGMKFLKQPHFTQGCVVKPGAEVPKAATALVGRALSQPSVELAGGERVQLDEVLGYGWSILRPGPAGKIRIQRIGADAPARKPGEEILVTDLDDAFMPLREHNVSLIVRPDRYVAAACLTGTESSALASLGRFAPALGTPASPPAASASTPAPSQH